MTIAPRLNAQSAQAVTVEGELEVLIEDHDDFARIVHVLRTEDNARIPIQFRDTPPGLANGTRVRLRGELRDGQLSNAELSSVASPELSSVASPELSSVASLAVSASRTLGEQKVLVILFNFAGNVSQPWTMSTINSVNDQVRNFYLENSYGQTTMNFTVAGWYTISASTSTCTSTDYNNWANLADAAATAAGYNINNYQRRFYAFPPVGSCGFAGVGNVGGPRAWTNGYYVVRTITHELGHNFGDYHSKQYYCSSGACSVNEYGDTNDVMGVPGTVAHLNAYQKERLGWLNYGVSPAIQTITANGNYAIGPYPTNSTVLPKALRILQSSSSYIYVEARTNYGVDSGLPAGVILHTGSTTSGDSSYQIDLDTATSASDVFLDPNQSFTFTNVSPPVTITTLSADASGATVQVEFGNGGGCTFGLSSTAQSFESSGGPGSVGLTAGSSCGWTASSTASWITLNSGSTSGTGPATIGFTVASNTTASARTGTLSIAGKTFTVTQSAGASCSYTVTPTSAQFPAGGGTGSANIATSADCQWGVTSGAPWVSASAASGSGSAVLNYTVATNTSKDTRSTTLTVAGQTITISQDAAAADFTSPTQGAQIVGPSWNFQWTAVAGAVSYKLSVGTTAGGSDLVNTSNITTTSYSASNLPHGRTLYATIRTNWNSAGNQFSTSSISFETIDRVSGVTLLGAQTPNPLQPGSTAQYGSSAGTSVKVSFTGSGSGCTVTLSASGLPAGAVATFSPTVLSSGAIEKYAQMSVSTAPTTPSTTHNFSISVQEAAACGGATVTTAATLVTSSAPGATALAVPSSSGVYGGTASLTAVLTNGSTPISSKTISFTLNGLSVGIATTNSSGQATLPLSLIAIPAGTYPTAVGASFAGDGNYNATSGSGTLTVTKKTVTPSPSARSKVYDRTTAATLEYCSLNGVIGSEDVTCTGVAAFDSPTAGSGKTVTVNSVSLTGTQAANYVLASTTASATASVMQRSGSAVVTVANKPYDGTTTATMTSCAISSTVAGDDVACTGTASFDTASVGANKAVTVSGLVLTGATAGNYVLTSTTTSATASIGDTDHAPVVTRPADQSSVENTAVSLNIAASDADGDALVFSAAGLPAGLTINASTGVISGTLTFASSGNYVVTVTVSDGRLSATTSFAWSVGNLNRTPSLAAVSAKKVSEGKTLTFALVGSDPDNDPLTYAASNIPSGAVVNAVTGAFSWTPTAGQAGTYYVTFSVSDGLMSASQTVKITVSRANRKVNTTSLTDRTDLEGDGVAFLVYANDPDGDELSYSGEGLPTGVTIDGTTGAVVGTLEAGTSRSYHVTVTVSDGELADEATFTWNVRERTPAACALTLSPRETAMGAGGGAGVIGVAVNSASCAWSATTAASWLTITGGASGSGDGVVYFAVARNDGAARIGAAAIGGKLFTVSQAAASTTCGVSITPPAATAPSTGGDGSFAVAPQTDCAWSATSSSPWLTVSSSPGDGRVDWTATPNYTPAARTASIAIGDTTVIVTQSAGSDGVPYDLSARASAARVIVTWKAPRAAAVNQYLVEVGSAAGLTDVLSHYTGTPSPSLVADGVADGTYYIRVRGVTAAGTTAASNEVVLTVGDATPAAPTALAARVNGDALTLNWLPAAGDAAPGGYFLEIGSASGASNLAAFPTGSAQTTFAAAAVAPGTYFARVRALRGSRRSAPSAEISFTIGAASCVAPAAPAGLSAEVNHGVVTLTWTAPNGEAPTAYQIEAGSAAGLSNLAVLDTGSSATTFVATAPPGVYYVRVKARSACGASGASAEVTVVVN